MLEINEMHPRKKSTRKMKNGVPKTWFLVLIFKNVIVFTPRIVVIYDVYKKMAQYDHEFDFKLGLR